MDPGEFKKCRFLDHALLREADLEAVQQGLLDQQYFYHGTDTDCLESIEQIGLYPNQERSRSRYVERSEPPAMRFSTSKEVVDLSVRAAIQKVHIDHPAGGAQPVLLRVGAASLLNRRFGLDRSHMMVMLDLKNLLVGKDCLTASEFTSVAIRRGSLASYDLIPSDELEVFCSDLSRLLKEPESIRNEPSWKAISER